MLKTRKAKSAQPRRTVVERHEDDAGAVLLSGRPGSLSGDRVLPSDGPMDVLDHLDRRRQRAGPQTIARSDASSG